MMTKKYYYIDAEVTVDLGAESSYDETQRAVDSGPLTIVFIGWLGDDIVTTSPFWFVSERLADALRASDLTGFELDPVNVEFDEQFELTGSQTPPSVWFRLIPTGSVEHDDDIALVDKTELAVSEAALTIFRSFVLKEATVEDY